MSTVAFLACWMLDCLNVAGRRLGGTIWSGGGASASGGFVVCIAAVVAASFVFSVASGVVLATGVPRLIGGVLATTGGGWVSVVGLSSRLRT
ncbi:MAG TPA: hypothetical protein VH120_02365, partial [Gemmataceae bacterium]|nr:hypothetical protein [Gemmataceae bacterium]